jgi:hypothetical protein
MTAQCRKRATGRGMQWGRAAVILAKMVRAAVLIEPVSAHSLPKTGIFAERAGDFPHFRPQARQSGRPETESKARKAGISGQFSRLLGSRAERRTAWLATQCCSHPSPVKFPANREFYREFCISEARRDDFAARKRCAAATFYEIPYAD